MNKSGYLNNGSYSSGRTMVIAHRGASALAYHENTLEAFQIAIDLHVDMVEFDVRRTRDNVLIVYHDPAIDGHIIYEMTYNRINDIASRSGYRVPALEEVLDLCKGKIKLDIELKESGYERRVIDMVKQRYGYGEFSIKSFKDRVSYNVKAIDPKIRTGLLLGRENVGFGVRLNEYFPERRMKKCSADFVSPHYLLCTREYVKRLQKKSIPIYVWTVNDRKIMKKLIRQGVTAIISDRPDVLNNVIISDILKKDR